MAVCPFADQSRRYDGKYPGSYVAGFAYRLVPHSTETTGLPSYSGGSVAPHFTVDPRTGRIWQHYDTSRPSRALEHRPGTIDTNNARAVQVEIIAYSDAVECRKVKGLYIGSLTPAQQAPVRKLFDWILTTHGIARVTVPTKVYPASYGDNNGVRLSDAAWRSFRGVAEHQNVPHNNHGDAGALVLAPLLKTLQVDPLEEAMAFYETRADFEEALRRNTVGFANPALSPSDVYGLLLETHRAATGLTAASIAAAVAAQVGTQPGGFTLAELTQATEAGVRAALGSLDNPTGA